MLYIGLMSGTSADGIDAVLVELSDREFRIIATPSTTYSPGIKQAIESTVAAYPNVEDRELRRLDRDLGNDFARAATELIHKAGPDRPIVAIGSHGQTVYHGPADQPPATVQLGSPQLIADRTGLTTVGDFRANDLRAGGQGAPLAPAFHNAMFRCSAIDRLVINIGGIANLTCLPANPARPVLGFDTGPGNTLMDQWCRLHTGAPYDDEGRWASRGRVDPLFVSALMDDPYFAAPAPKSTGREYFHLEWMRRRYPGWRGCEPVDVQAGLLEVTARSIAQAATAVRGENDCEAYVCGGGARNAALMNRLRSLLGAEVMTTEALGLPPEWVEACAFAWLAHRRISERPGNLPSVTGADKQVLLGEIFRPGA